MPQRALDQPPPDWRAAVVPRDLEGLSTDEAAEIIGIRQAAFTSRLHRGRIQLRGCSSPSWSSVQADPRHRA